MQELCSMTFVFQCMMLETWYLFTFGFMFCNYKTFFHKKKLHFCET